MARREVSFEIHLIRSHSAGIPLHPNRGPERSKQEFRPESERQKFREFDRSDLQASAIRLLVLTGLPTAAVCGEVKSNFTRSRSAS